MAALHGINIINYQGYVEQTWSTPEFGTKSACVCIHISVYLRIYL